MKQRVLKVVRITMAFALMAGLVVGLYPTTASAQSTANTLKITPVRTDVTINPGESKTVQTTVSNLTDDAITVRPSINDFVAGGENGEPALILDDTEYASRSLKRFVTPLDDITIAPHSAKTINVLITVPRDTRPGGYFGAVRFAPTAPDGGGQVNLSVRVASLILLTVAGKTEESMQLSDFLIQQAGQSGTNFRDGKDVQVTFRFQNDGDIQLGPIGYLVVKKGNDVAYETSFNNATPREVVLPDSARRWTLPIEKVDSFWHYTVTATFTYGSDNQTIEVTKDFWVIPWFVIIIAIASLVLVIGVIIGIIFFLRGRKRRMAHRHINGRRLRR